MEPTKMNQEQEKFFREFFRWSLRTKKDMLKPSLQLMSMVKIAIELWNQNDLRESTLKFKFIGIEVPNFRDWRKIEDKALAKVTQLPIPERLKRELISVISPIGVEIKNWWGYHQWEIDISKLPDQFVWTSRGTIDRKSTAEMLIKDEDIDVNTRYKLSCINCLEKEIPELWNRIPEQQKSYYYSDQMGKYTTSHGLIMYWTYISSEAPEMEEMIRKHMWPNSSVHTMGYLQAISKGNVVATEFFYGKLSDEEKPQFVVVFGGWWGPFGRLFSRNTEEYSSEVFFFLLSKLNEDQQVHLINRIPYGVLSCFLDRPFQPFFMELAEQIMALERNGWSRFEKLLLSVSQKVNAGWKDFDYRQLFCDLWHLSPLALKREAICSKNFFSLILSNLLETGEKSIINMLVEHVDFFFYERLILIGGVLRHMVNRERWDSVELFLDMFYPSKEAMTKLKDTLVSDDVKRSFIEIDESNWVRLFHVLDELIAMKSEVENVEQDVDSIILLKYW